MLSKLTNGLAGTWESLDERERILVLAGLCYAAIGLLMVIRAPYERERKRKERDELVDAVARRLSG